MRNDFEKSLVWIVPYPGNANDATMYGYFQEVKKCVALMMSLHFFDSNLCAFSTAANVNCQWMKYNEIELKAEKRLKYLLAFIVCSTESIMHIHLAMHFASISTNFILISVFIHFPFNSDTCCQNAHSIRIELSAARIDSSVLYRWLFQ